MAQGLTEKTVLHAKASKSRREVPDRILPGLYLVVQPSGTKSWAVRYRFEGQPRKYTIGRYPLYSLADARKRGRDVLMAVGEGKDPGKEKAAAKREAKKPERKLRSKIIEFDKVADDFMERHAKPNTRDWKNTESMLRRHWVSRWGNTSIHDIKKRDVLDVLEELVDDGGLGPGANRSFSVVRKLFNWLVENDRLQISPTHGLKKPVPESERDRYLSDFEIYLWWMITEDLPYPWQGAYRLILLTGQRFSEVVKAPWTEFNGNHWSLPGTRTKNKLPQELLLPRQATEIISALPRMIYTDESGRERRSPFLFTTTGYSPVSGFSKKNAELRGGMEDLAKRIAAERGEDPESVTQAHFTLHDARRTVSTDLGKLKVRTEVIEAALNHISGTRSGVAGTYNRWEYFDEKGEALQLWADYIDRVVAEHQAGNVVRLSA